MGLQALVSLLCLGLAVAFNRPPNMVKHPEKVIWYKPMKSVEIACIAEGIPNPTYKWKRHGIDFNISGNDDRVVQLPNQGTIVFSKPEPKDEGIFQCFADNGYGIAASVRVNFREAKLARFPYEERRVYDVQAGYATTLQCYPPQSFPPADVYWVIKERDNRWQAINFDKRVSMDIEGRLRITNVKQSDEYGGRAYACMAQNNFTGDNSIGPEIEIRVFGSTEQIHAAAELWTSPSDHFFAKGTTARLKCIFSGNPTPDVYWERINGSLPDRASIESFGQELQISDVQMEDAGMYKCMGLNNESKKPATKVFDVNIESAPEWTTEPQNQEKTEGEKATFICKAFGVPAPVIEWFINGVSLADSPDNEGVRDPRIYNNPRFHKVGDNNITLTNLTLEDHMSIQCNASSKQGYVFSNVYLNVMTTVLGSPCSVQNRTSNLPDCINRVKTRFMDYDAFWFGGQYATRCPLKGASYDLKCTNIRPNFADSFGTRFFQTNVRNSLDRFLSVRFESIGRNYTGCGTTYTWDGKERVNIDVDPLSNDVETPWFVRNTPNITWSSNASDYYTLIVYDAGYLFCHGVYVNVRGNDLSSGQVVKEYHGPKRSFDLPNPYIFLLYKHPQPVDVTEELKNIILNANWTQLWPIHEFAKRLNLGDPVAVNWMVVTGDEYGAAMSEQGFGMFNCPDFSTKALHRMPRPFFSNTTQLSVWLDVTMTTESLNYSVCCNKYKYGAGTRKLDPIGNRIYNTADVRSEATIIYTLKKEGYPSNFIGEMYSIVTMDPDVPSPTVGTQERPLLHGLIINIRDGNFSTGEVVRNYLGPAPPDNKPHYYYFMLYRHNVILNATAMPSYSSDPNNGRYLFDIKRLVSDHNMTLVGATWLRAKTDDYVTYNLVDSDPASESSLCAAYPGYSNPCPTSGSTMGPTSGSTRVLLLKNASLPFVGLALHIVFMAFSALGKHVL